MNRIPSRPLFFLSLILAAMMTLAPAAPASAQDRGLARKQSAHSVSETIDRLAEIVEQRGAKVFARVDHAAGAAAIDQELLPAQLLIFGNPKLGTPLLQESSLMGLDLPIHMLAYEDQNGRVWLVYRRIRAVSQRHGVRNSEAEAAIERAMNGLSAAATSTD